MESGILRFLLNLLRERGSALLGLARKGLDALGSVLRSARGLIGPLIKRAISWVMAKASPVAATARGKVNDTLAGLKRMAEAARQGALPPETELEEPEIAVEPAEEVWAGEAVGARDVAPAEQALDEPASAVDAEAADEPVDEAPASSPPLAHAGGYRTSGGAELALLAPAIGRALVRALSRRRLPRADVPGYAPLS